MGLSQQTLAGVKEFPGRARHRRSIRRRDAHEETQSSVCETPRTNFIAAHLGFTETTWRGWKTFDSYPNVYVDIAAVLANWGAALFGARFSGQISGPRADGERHLRSERIQMYFRALETRTNILSITGSAMRSGGFTVSSARRRAEEDLL